MKIGWMTRGVTALGALAAAAGPATAGQAVIYIDSFRAEQVDGAAEITAMLAARGITATTIEPVAGQDPGDLSPNTCVWDLRIDSALTLVERIRYEDYLRLGGGLYMSGEHGTFQPRNDSIADVVTNVGGGTITTDTTGPSGTSPVDIIEPTNPDSPLATDCNAVSEVVYDGVANGHFLSIGTGEWVSGDGVMPGAAMWGAGTLPGAIAARAVIVMDSNWCSPGPRGTLDFRVTDRSIPTENRAFLDNVITNICGFSCTTTCDPRDHGYWHRYCLGTDLIDPGRNGQGEGPGPARDADLYPAGLPATVDAALAPHGILACAALDEGPFSDERLAALRELATLRFNMAAERLSPGCPVELAPVEDADGLTVGDALALVEARIAVGTEEALREARWIAEHVNVGEALLKK